MARALMDDAFGATRGVMVSTPAFLACYQCCSAGSSLGRGLNFRASVRDNFEARRQGFSPVNGSPPQKKAKINPN